MNDSLTQLIDFLIQGGRQWIRTSQAKHRPDGRALTEDEVQAVGAFFPAPLLAHARVAEVPIIENPPFYADLQRLGMQIPLDFTIMAGITFENTIVVSTQMKHGTPWIGLLFHELVHVVQYSILGIDEFINRYVMGWAANGQRYENIPLERNAYSLDARFSSAPSIPFDVRGEVAAFLQQPAA